MTEKTSRRKFQVCRSHLLEFKHLSRVLNSLSELGGREKIGRSWLRQETGLPDGQVESLINIAVAMGLVKGRVQTLTPTGWLIVKHDIFLEGQGTLEWCHYTGAGSYRNLVWFDVFNHLLVEEKPMTVEGWQGYFTGKLSGRYSDKTVKDQVPKEVRFIIDAYLKRNFRQLELLHLDPAGRLYRRRYTAFEPTVLCAMIYAFCAGRGLHNPQVGEMAVVPGSPAVLFGLDVATFRQWIEELHDRGWLRYETTHDLDQVRLIPGFRSIDFLAAHYEGCAPRKSGEGDPELHVRGRPGSAREAGSDPGSDPQRGLFE